MAKCRNGHALTKKTMRIRWAGTPRVAYPRCKLCESEQKKQRYRCDAEYREYVRNYNRSRNQLIRNGGDHAAQP